MIKKWTTLITLISILSFSCSTSNVLLYKKQKYYTENNIISSKEMGKIHQRVCYNNPQIKDEEHCHELSFTIKNIESALQKKIINIETDTDIVKCEYSVFSTWNWDNENNKVSGTFEILKWTKDEIELNENIIINDYRRKTVKTFKGKRTFIKKG